MADIFKLKDKVGDLVCDAIPDPPRSVNNNSIRDRPNLSQEDQQENEQKTNIPIINNDESSTSNATSDKSDESKSDRTKYSKPKKRSTPAKVVNNISIVGAGIVRIGPTTKHVYNLNACQNPDRKSFNKSKAEGKKETREMPPHIQDLSRSDEKITKDHMLMIHVHLGKGWKEVAEKLGFSVGQIDQFLKDYESKGISEVIYQVLLQWQQIHTQNATIGQLVSAMWSAQEYDCAERFAIAHETKV